MKEKRQNGILEPAKISQVLVADGAAHDGASGRRTIWLSELAFLGGGATAAAATTTGSSQPGAEPARAAIEFHAETDLFQCAPGGSASLDGADPPHPGTQSMRWHFSYGGDWQWCTKLFAEGTAAGASVLYFWIRSDTVGAILLSVGESSREGFYALVPVEQAWQRIEHTMTSAS